MILQLAQTELKRKADILKDPVQRLQRSFDISSAKADQ